MLAYCSICPLWVGDGCPGCSDGKGDSTLASQYWPEPVKTEVPPPQPEKSVEE